MMNNGKDWPARSSKSGVYEKGFDRMNKVLRILHLEDDPDYSDLAMEMLEREGLRVERVLVDNYANFIAALENNKFDLILGDYSLPDCNGLQALQIARQKCPDTPFLLISGVIGEVAAVE